MLKNNKFLPRKIALRAGKILAILCGIIIVFLLVITLIVHFSRDSIRNYIVNEINKNLLSEIQVSDVSLSVFNSFPYVSLEFSDVLIPEVISGTQGKEVLISAGLVSLKFNIFDILRKKYVLKRVNISKADCHLKILKDGTPNYLFWREDTISDGTSDFELLLQRVRLEEVEFQYSNLQNDIFLSLFAEKFLMYGSFYESRFDMTFSGNLQSHFLTVGSNSMIEEIPVECSGKMLADNDKDSYTFEDVLLKFRGVTLFVQGTYLNSEIPVVDFTVRNEKCSVSDLETLLPTRTVKELEPFDKKGNISISSVIQGPLSSSKMPSLKLEARLDNARLIREENGIVLENLSFQISYSCRNLLQPENSLLQCSHFSAGLESGKISGNFTINGFTSSSVELNIDAELELTDIQKLLQIDGIENMSGKIICHLDFSGDFDDINNISVSDFLNASSTGLLTSDKIELKLKSFRESIYILSLNGIFNQDDLDIEHVKLLSAGSDIQFKGTIHNIFPFLLIENQKLHIKGEANSDVIYADRLLAANNSPDDKSNDEVYMDLSDFLRFELVLKVRELNYDTFTGKDVRTNMILNNKLLLLRDMSFKSMDGLVDAEVIIDTRPENNIEFRVMANLKNVNIKKTFKDLQDFGQNSLTHENLKGSLSGTVHMSSVWTKQLEIDWNSLTVVADIEVKNGSVSNYEPLAGLRKYFKNRNFTNVEFATLTNQIVIRDQEILIPQMRIQSSVMDFEMLGTHYFDNRINYNFKIQFSELVRKQPSASKQRAEDEYGYVLDENDNRLLWNFKVTGTVDDPKFVPLDLQSVTVKAKQDFKDEGKKAVNILQKEFGNKKDSTQKIIEHEDEEEKKLLIKWDDE